MKYGYIGAFVFAAYASSGGAQAAAHCWADVEISSPQKSVSANTNWDSRTNGGNWIQQSGNHRSECDDLAANHFNSLDLAAFAKENGMCGTITASGSSYVGTSEKRGSLGPKSIEVPCGDDGAGGAEAKSDYQYASKLICAAGDSNVALPGIYRAAVNIHNPGYESVDFRYKFATAEQARDGNISYFTDSKIGPDGAQYFNCENVQKIAGAAEPIDGFFVIESREPLDVVTYYSAGGEKAVEAIEVETTKERKIVDGRRWSCGNQRSTLEAASGWTINNVPATTVQTFDGNPITTVYNQGGMNIWLSDRADLTSNQAAGNYRFRLPFCLCGSGTEYKSDALITVGALRGDNSVTANVDGQPDFVTGQNAHNAPLPGHRQLKCWRSWKPLPGIQSAKHWIVLCRRVLGSNRHQQWPSGHVQARLKTAAQGRIVQVRRPEMGA